MRNVIYAALLIATPAAAQPVTQPKACQVTIARAPDDVRAVVETWVRSEAQCSIALEVRIVPTEGGYYLLAQDEHGGMRERIVPDAQTAGVLVASWIADDNAPATQPVPAPSPRAATSPPAPVPVAESITPPGLAPIAIAAAATVAAPVQRSKWASVAGLVSMTDGGGGGVRAEIDLWKRGRWIVGGAASVAETQHSLYSSYGSGYLTARDLKAIGYIARPSSFGRWELRPAAGVGVIHTEGLAYDGGSGFYPLEGTFPTVEASVMLSREFGKHWAVYTGPLATVITQEFTSSSSSSSSYPMSISRGDIDLVLFAGVRHRL